MENYCLDAKDGHKIEIDYYKAEKERVILTLVPDINEDKSQYSHLFNLLSDSGISLVVIGIRGQLGDDIPLFLSERNGWNNQVDDIHRALIHFDNTNHMLMGVGFGADLARTYLYKYGETLRGCILLNATPYINFLKNWVMEHFIDHLSSRYGSKHRSSFISHLAYDLGFNPFKSAKNNFKEADEDKIPTISLVRDHLMGIKKSQEEHLNYYIPDKLPILFLSEIRDKKTGGRVKKEALVDFYSSLSKNAELIMYDQVEILNPDKNENLIKDIKEFINRCLK